MSRCRFRIPACIRSRLRASRVCSLSPRIWPSRDDLDPRSNRRPRSRRIAPICVRYCGKSINLHSNPTHGISVTYWPTIIYCATNIHTDMLRHSIAYWFNSPVWLSGKSIKLHRKLTLWFLVSYLLSTICFATTTQASNALRDSNWYAKAFYLQWNGLTHQLQSHVRYCGKGMGLPQVRRIILDDGLLSLWLGVLPFAFPSNFPLLSIWI